MTSLKKHEYENIGSLFLYDFFKNRSNGNIILDVGGEIITDKIEWRVAPAEYFEDEFGSELIITTATAEKYGNIKAEETVLDILILLAENKAKELGVNLNVRFLGYKPEEEDPSVYATIGWRGVKI